MIDSAAAALGLPSVAGSGQPALAARTALVAVVGRLLSTRQMARALAISPGSVRRLRRRQVDSRIVQAIQLQMELRSRLTPDAPTQ